MNNQSSEISALVATTLCRIKAKHVRKVKTSSKNYCHNLHCAALPERVENLQSYRTPGKLESKGNVTGNVIDGLF